MPTRYSVLKAEIMGPYKLIELAKMGVYLCEVNTLSCVQYYR